jgi:long-chain acyl-CoA synthetase
MIIIEKPDNLVDHFEISTDKFADNLLFGTKDKTAQTYSWVSYGEVRKRVDNFRGGLANLGVQAGDCVGIISDNRTEWAVAMYASAGLRARFIPMYEREILRIWQYIIVDSNVKVLIVPNREIYEKVKHLEKELENLSKIIIIDDDSDLSMKHLEDLGTLKPVSSQKPKFDEIAVLIYTSGTTAEPKGVLLTHGNIVSNARAGFHRYHMLNAGSRSLSILPWAHSYGLTAELVNWFFFGGSIGFIEKVDTLADDIQKVQPTFLIAVPRVFNTIYDNIRKKVDLAGGISKKMFLMSVKAAEQDRLLQGKAGFVNKLKLGIGNKLVFSKIRQKFGNKLVAAITASAKMNRQIADFFFDIGLPVYDCYGLSETSPAISMNSPELNKPGSVGTPLEFVQVRIDKTQIDEKNSPDGEIQVKGPNVMQGYHNKPDATQSVFTSDGWLKTGDRGMIDEDGYLFITGRIKEQYKLENGKYVFPAAIEEDIRLLPYIENTMVFGDGKPYNVALIIPDCEILKKTAELLKVKTSVGKLLHMPMIQEFIALEIRKNLEGKYGHYEIPKKYLFIDDKFTVENGFLTQTLKVKRRMVLEKYEKQIEELYLSEEK